MNKKLVTSTLLLAAICLFILAEFLQIGRKPPELAPVEQRASRVEIDKASRRLTLLNGNNVLATYAISLGSAPTEHKSREGDGRTPEGTYFVDSKNQRSRFHLALHVSYPSADDRKTAQQLGVSPGGDIMIHGLPNGLGWLSKLHLKRDWTDGCIAVTNNEIEDVWRLVAIGTPVEIRP